MELITNFGKDVSHEPLIPTDSNIHYFHHLIHVASNYEQWHTAAARLDE